MIAEPQGCNTLGFICLTGWYFKGLAMYDPLAVRDKAWIDAFAVFRKFKDDAWVAYNNANANANANASPEKAWGYACAILRDKYGRDSDSWIVNRAKILAEATAFFEKVRADTCAKANADRDNAIANAWAILEKARANADAVYEKHKGK